MASGSTYNRLHLPVEPEVLYFYNAPRTFVHKNCLGVGRRGVQRPTLETITLLIAGLSRFVIFIRDLFAGTHFETC
jgi:hypothetical protein